jgi:hypothetical protein
MVANVIQVTLDVPEVSANTSEENDLTVKGLKVGDAVTVIPHTFSAGLAYEPTVVATDDTLPVRAINSTGSGINPDSGTYTLVIFRPEGIPANQTKITT